MACDVDPLGLMDGSRHGIGSPLLSRPDMEPSSRSFDFFDNIHQVRWDASVPEFSIDEGVSSQLVETPLEPVVKFEGANGRLDPHPPLSNNSPVAQPLDWRQATPSSNSSSKRGMCSIQGKNKNLEAGSERPTKRRRSQSKTNSSPSSLDEDFGFAENPRPGKLEKNRVAASKCREKKKRETASLQARERALAAERDALKSMAEALRTEVLGLKNEVLKHGMCDCSVIQKYITETARQMA